MKRLVKGRMTLFGEALILTAMGALASFSAPRGELATSYGDCPKSSMRVAVGTMPNRVPVKVGGFWREEFRRLTVKWIPHCIREMEKGGRGEELLNLVAAGEVLAGKRPSVKFKGAVHTDAYPYNTVEAICLALQVDPDDDVEWRKAQDFLRTKLEEWIHIFLAAQEKSGYIHSYHALTGKPHFSNVDEHELYVMGYFIEMGVAHMRLTGGKDRRLFDAAIRCADHLDATFGPAPKRTWMNGHPGIEYAFLRLADAVNHWDGAGKGDRYARLAQFFVRNQHAKISGPGIHGTDYNQSNQPAESMSEVRGHAVRACYFSTAMEGIGRRCADHPLAAAADRLFDSLVDRKYYLTGAVGATRHGEAFGPDYELPQEGYCESCAGCGLAFWCLERAAAHPGATRPWDVYERVLYNNVLGAVSQDGVNFFYQNPLLSAKTRYPWHDCPCCIGNIPRTLFALKDNIVSVSADGRTLYVNNYMDIETDDFRMETGYPNDGKVKFTVKRGEYDRILARFPNRAESKLYRVEPAVEHGYREVRGEWTLPLPEQTVTAIPEVKACAGLQAVQRGPIVYSWEGPNFDAKVPNHRRLNHGGQSRVWIPALLDRREKTHKAHLTRGEAKIVPTGVAELLLPQKTLLDVQTNAVCARTVGRYFFPGELYGARKTVVAGTAARPEKLHVEMQLIASGFLKCVVLELAEGTGGVWGRTVAAGYLPSAAHDYGFAFERPDGTFAGTPMKTVMDENERGYGVRDLTLMPIEVRGPGVDCERKVADPAAAIAAGRGVIARFAGEEVAKALRLELIPSAPGGRPVFEIADGGRTLRASDAATLAKAFYTDVTRKGAGICAWGNNRFDRKAWEASAPDLRVVSPYRRHAYMQVCAMGYTTPFWDEARWMEEIDWMALHGFDLPLVYPAYEAIFARVLKKRGLTEKEILSSFCGPAHLPWSRMGNTSGGPDLTPPEWLARSIRIQHAIMKRLRELGMDAILQGFAGVVPEGLRRVAPQAKIVETGWHFGGHHAWLILPEDPLFAEIGTDFIRTWEEEFGAGTYYLADSFNECGLPWKDEAAIQRGLKACGAATYNAIKAANPNAVWALMGWILFDTRTWTPERAAALFSAVPDDKLLVLEMAVNNYSMNEKRVQWGWMRHPGFYGKQWVWSTIPNFGGRTLFSGDLGFYANAHLQALSSPTRGNLFAYGTMPEGMEQNDVVFELVSSAGWSDRLIDTDAWLANYSRCRWGLDGTQTSAYWQAMRRGYYGKWSNDIPARHVNFNWMLDPYNVKGEPYGHKEHQAALREMLALAREQGERANALFRADFAVQAAHEAGQVAELLLATGKPADVDAAYRLIEGADAVMAGHPTHDVRRWIARARDCAEGNEALANAYETNARRIITTWGPALDGYAARFWSGTVKDYYLARLRLVREAKKKGADAKAAVAAFQKQWIDGRLPIAPPVPGWTSEKLAEETLVLGRRFLSAKALRPCTM